MTLSPSTLALIVDWAAAPPVQSPPLSPLSPLSSYPPISSPTHSGPFHRRSRPSSPLDLPHTSRLLLTREMTLLETLERPVINGPFQFGMVDVPTTPTTPTLTRPRTYDDITYKEKIHEACDIRAMNIVFQGLPPVTNTKVLVASIDDSR
ncbi:hypothetical protein Tco_1070892 [Tanacetum coccineum]|uniref:Uncharacterized protein n=1 Tax=Tanacetum coccineum TaxID=301880 RepID=A0ABQ5HPH9_9ASTR